MSFIVTKDITNGYRCCCTNYEDYTEVYDTLDEALQQLPTELIDGKPLPFNADLEIAEIEIKNSYSEEVIAHGKVEWSWAGFRGSAYKYTLWSGFRPDVGEFSVIYDSARRVVLDKTWEELIDSMKK